MTAPSSVDLVEWLGVLFEAEDALALVVRECEEHRWGKPGYDATLDHLWDECEPTLKRVRAALSEPETTRRSA